MKTFKPKRSCKVKYLGVELYVPLTAQLLFPAANTRQAAGTPRVGAAVPRFGAEPLRAPTSRVRERTSCAARGTAAGLEMAPRLLWHKSRASGLYRVCRCCRTSLAIARVAVMYCTQRRVVAIFLSFISLRTGVVYFLLTREWTTLFLCSDPLQL